jgi:hypothetical protein
LSRFCWMTHLLNTVNSVLISWISSAENNGEKCCSTLSRYHSWQNAELLYCL